MVSQFFLPPVKGLTGWVPHVAPHLNVTATGTEELPMSSKGAGKFTAATLSHPARRPITPRPGADHAPGQDGAAVEGVLATRTQPPRRSTAPARVGPTWRSEPHSYNDPCNYLG